MNTLLTCKEDYEKILEREIALYQGTSIKRGRGWILAQGPVPHELCFAHQLLEEPQAVREPSVNALADKLVDIFAQHLGTTRLEKNWSLGFLSGGDEKLIQRAGTIEKRFLERLQKKMSRVAKLARHATSGQGFFVTVTDFKEAFVSFKAASFGQKRMQMDPNAPSRSYLKLEEAFSILGFAPKPDESVVDLGAAPGGWSHSALLRGAHVTAVDNGPLKEPVKSHPHVEHLQTNAFKYMPQERADWLLCDMLEAPEIVLDLLQQWLDKGKCLRFVVNLKLQRTDPILLLKKIRHSKDGLSSKCRILKIRQLYHDREEITVMGEV